MRTQYSSHDDFTIISELLLLKHYVTPVRTRLRVFFTPGVKHTKCDVL